MRAVPTRAATRGNGEKTRAASTANAAFGATKLKGAFAGRLRCPPFWPGLTTSAFRAVNSHSSPSRAVGSAYRVEII
eukprot:scaffold2436_cov249-Pinguiococcus_pyrenoidosus.AAC.2